MKRIYTLWLCLLVWAMTAPAQTQQGYVKTKGRLNANGTVTPGDRLTGATIAIQNGNSVVSGTNGTFTLRLSSNKFVLKSVTKNNFVIADPDFLKKQYDCSANDFVIVMEDELEKANERRQIEKKVRNNLNAQAEKQRDEINRLRQENKITEEKYRELQQKVNNDEDENEAIIKDMVEKYSKIDFDQEDDFDRRFSAFLLNGETLRADSLLRTKGNILKELNDFKAFQAVNAEMRAEQAVRDSIENRVKTELADWCYKNFELFKTKHEHDSTTFYIEERASLDTTNVRWQKEAASFIYQYIADYDKAIRYYLRAIAVAIAQDGENSEAVAHIYNDIGKVYDDMGQYEKAQEYYSLSIPIWEELFGKNHPNMAATLNNIGCLYSEQRDYEKALEYAEKALSIDLAYHSDNQQQIEEGTVEDNAGQIVTDYITVGTFLHYMHNYEEALRYYNLASDGYNKMNRTDDPDQATLYDNMGSLYSDIKDYDKSMEFHQKSLEIRKGLFGESHPDVAFSYNSMGNTLEEKGDYDKALECHRKALEIRKNVLGENHLSVATSYNNIAIVFSRQKNFEKALSSHLKALEIRIQNVGDNHPIVASSYYNIASVNAQSRNYDEALVYFEKALSIWTTAFGENYPNVAKAKKKIEEIKAKMKEKTEP